MHKIEACDNITNIFKDVRDVDDYILKSTKNLKIILLNLQIQAAQLKEINGINPIVIELDKTIKEIENRVKTLTSQRDFLNECLDVLKESKESEK